MGGSAPCVGSVPLCVATRAATSDVSPTWYRDGSARLRSTYTKRMSVHIPIARRNASATSGSAELRINFVKLCRTLLFLRTESGHEMASLAASRTAV
jgi:hypothetical protein